MTATIAGYSPGKLVESDAFVFAEQSALLLFDRRGCKRSKRYAAKETVDHARARFRPGVMGNAGLGHIGACLLQFADVANPQPNHIWNPRLGIIERSEMVGCVKGLNGLMFGRDVLADENVNVAVVYLCHADTLSGESPSRQ